MKAYVLSHRHHLLPVAWRLVREGMDVEVAVVAASQRYERAWTGKFKKFLTGKDKITEDSLHRLLERATGEGAYILTDSFGWTRRLGAYEKLFGALKPRVEGEGTGAVSLGAWFDGEGMSGHHVVVEDRGAWSGGLGPAVPSAITLVRPTNVPPRLEALLDGARDELKSEGFRGLVRMGFRFDLEERTFTRVSLEAGWPLLHTHAFAGDLESVNGVLQGFEPQFPRRFVVCVTVTTPPWPLDKCNYRPKRVEISGLEPEDMRHIWFHDIEVVGTKVMTAGVDGMVAVVRGSADHLELARQRALVLAQKMQVPEKQYRFDAGGQVDRLLILLEELGLPM